MLPPPSPAKIGEPRDTILLLPRYNLFTFRIFTIWCEGAMYRNSRSVEFCEFYPPVCVFYPQLLRTIWAEILSLIPPCFATVCNKGNKTQGIPLTSWQCYSKWCKDQLARPTSSISQNTRRFRANPSRVCEIHLLGSLIWVLFARDDTGFITCARS